MRPDGDSGVIPTALKIPMAGEHRWLIKAFPARVWQYEQEIQDILPAREAW